MLLNCYSYSKFRNWNSTQEAINKSSSFFLIPKESTVHVAKTKQLILGVCYLELDSWASIALSVP